MTVVSLKGLPYNSALEEVGSLNLVAFVMRGQL